MVSDMFIYLSVIRCYTVPQQGVTTEIKKTQRATELKITWNFFNTLNKREALVNC